MDINLHLHSADELEAFANFCNDLAVVRRNAPPLGALTNFGTTSDTPESNTEAGTPPTEKAPRTRAKKADKPAPEVKPESAENKAQDKADEKAESAAATTETLTHDSVRNALGEYVNLYGIDAAQEDGPKLLKLVFGEGINKVSLIPETQEALAKAITGVKEMIAKNPYMREKVSQ